jgi:DNA polymerase-3 subunit delta
MPRVSVATLWQRLTQGQVDPLYFLCGEETYLIQEYTTALIERILGTAPRDFNCDVFSAESDALADVLSVAHTLPMMAAYRVVVYHGLEQLPKADWPPLEAYLAQPSASTAFICSSSESEPKKCSRRLWEHATTVVCTGLEGSKLHQWVAQTVTTAGYRITEEAIQSLLQDQEADLHTLRQELVKLCTYVGPPGEISLHDVHAVSPASRLHSVFALADALGARQSATALVEIDHLLNQGEPPLVILSMIVRHLRLLWSVQQLIQQRQDLPRIAKTLRVPLTVCRQVAAQSRTFSSERLLQLYTVALEADLAFKSSNKPPKAILEGLVLEICART